MRNFTIILVLFAYFNTSYSQDSMMTSKSQSEMFEEFKMKEKFIQEEGSYYPGIAEEKLRPIFTEKINLAAEDFQKVAEGKDPTQEKYLKAIDQGLDRFREIYLELDTEDRERVCLYFEELMDIVGLESSGGRLNKFLYGFDPSEE
ncbi:DUF4844 domain-containing protein [Robiginitalea sp. M366]|uniref:DUF4844 domain-containing protein n=1 Tax=Robiginitalea aestuariiviva TaxID=3036903 RepID=UPI00240E8188|nr:DUF4844 domain-containing protein [Robiginitalea aestuariiviva]MDG1572509.1 DUF4844 domain-containing protein [Robiginitalea aestuariiviva]